MTFLPDFNNLWTSREKGQLTALIHQAGGGGTTLIWNMIAFLYEENPDYRFAFVCKDPDFTRQTYQFCILNNLSANIIYLNKISEIHNDMLDFVFFADPQYSIEPNTTQDYINLSQRINAHIVIQQITRDIDRGIHSFNNFNSIRMYSTILAIKKNDTTFSVSLLKSRKSSTDREQKFSYHFKSKRFIPLSEHNEASESFFNITNSEIVYLSPKLDNTYSTFENFCSQHKLKLYVQEFLKEKTISQSTISNIVFINYYFINFFILLKNTYPKFDPHQFVNKLANVKSLNHVNFFNNITTTSALLKCLPEKLAYDLFFNGLFEDCSKMMSYILSKEENYTIKKTSWKSLHDALEAKAFELSNIENSLPFTTLFLNNLNNKTIKIKDGDLTVFIPQTGLEVFELGKKMNLCIRSPHYIKQIRENTLNFVILKDSLNNNKYCFAFNNKKELIECKKRDNQIVDKEEETLIIEALFND